MLEHETISAPKLRQRIRHGLITFAGHRPGKIYGRLQCRSGKRMKRANRVFFADAAEARQHGYRPCAHCMPLDYKHWKDGLI